MKSLRQNITAVFSWLHWGVFGAVGGFALAFIEGRPSVAWMWVWLKVGGGMLCILFGILMEMCRRQLRLMSKGGS